MAYLFSCYKSNDGHLVVLIWAYLKSILFQPWVIVTQIKGDKNDKIALQQKWEEEKMVSASVGDALPVYPAKCKGLIVNLHANTVCPKEPLDFWVLVKTLMLKIRASKLSHIPIDMGLFSKGWGNGQRRPPVLMSVSSNSPSPNISG